MLDDAQLTADRAYSLSLDLKIMDPAGAVASALAVLAKQQLTTPTAVLAVGRFVGRAVTLDPRPLATVAQMFDELARQAPASPAAHLGLSRVVDYLVAHVPAARDETRAAAARHRRPVDP